MCGCPWVWIRQCSKGHRVDFHGNTEPPPRPATSSELSTTFACPQKFRGACPVAGCDSMSFVVLGGVRGEDEDLRAAAHALFLETFDSAFKAPAAQVDQ